MSAYRSILVIALVCMASAFNHAQAGVDEGVARYVPWSGSFWPIGQGQLIRGPLAKYDHASGHRAAEWEYLRNPPGPQVPEWFGYCHAWAAAAVLDREPVRQRGAMGQGGYPVYLGIGDQKGMLTACHTGDIAQHYGVRHTGAPGEDPNAIYPDQLWRVLKLYLQQQGIPLVVDIDAGPEVWNYPVFAYRVLYRPTGLGDQYFGEMSILMADDAVPPDCIGVKVGKQTYYFVFRMQQGKVVLGSGRWIGPSVRTHPDFAWYPQIVRPENPEVHYASVKRLVDASGSGPVSSTPTGSELPRPRTQRPSPPSAEAQPWGRIPVRRNVVPGASSGTHLSTDVVPQSPSRAPAESGEHAYVVSPVELLSLVTNQTSSFTLDVTVDKFDSGRYTPGEPLAVSGSSARAGYLYLFYLDGQGRMSVMFPYGGADNRIPAQRRFQVAGRGGAMYRTWGQPGTHRIKAVVTSMPLVISGLAPPDDSGARPQEFRLPPSHRALFTDILGRYQARQPIGEEELGGVSPRQFLGEFAQDEVAFYVGPAE